MGFSIHRRWLWLFGTLALLGLLFYGVARSLAEPVRRYMETEANRHGPDSDATGPFVERLD